MQYIFVLRAPYVPSNSLIFPKRLSTISKYIVSYSIVKYILNISVLHKTSFSSTEKFS